MSLPIIMIHMEKRHWQIVTQILGKYPYEFYAFGSRIRGNEHRFSDLDLCYKETIPFEILGKITEDFEESDLPFKIDLVDYNACSDDFKKLIDKDIKAVVSLSAEPYP